MKIAFVNCRTMPWGVMQVLNNLLIKALRKNWPEAQIQLFTLISEEKQLHIPIPWSPEKSYTIPIIQALPNWLARIFLYFKKRKVKMLSSIFDYRNLIVFYPLFMKILSKKIKKRKPDKVQISSFAIAKNIDPIGVPTSLYLHSPMQYIRSHYEEYLGKFHWWKKWLFKKIAPKLRKRDQSYTKFDTIISNSHYTQNLAKQIYGFSSTVHYPTISDQYRYMGISQTPKPYFVCVGRLVSFVRECEVIIKLFNELRLPLLMIGSGPDEEKLKNIAGETIIFTGRMQEWLAETIKDSSGLINLTKESFGIGTAEALLMGVPVLGFEEGASAELIDQDSGILVADKSLPTLKKAMHEFMNRGRDRKRISENIRYKLQNNK